MGIEPAENKGVSSTMTNAKEELSAVLDSLDGSPTIEAARFAFGEDPGWNFAEVPEEDTFVLLGSPLRVDEMWAFLDREYYSGYGSQDLFGTVWLSDGTWLTRGEYDGSEWWVHHARPPRPTKETPWEPKG